MTTPAGTPGPETARLSAPWAAHASAWARIGSPLRPCPEDVARLRQAWADSLPGGLPPRSVEVLLLGVTPEYALFPWAEKSRLRALDANAAMLRSVWPGDSAARQAVTGDWRAMPFAAAAFDLILCDAGLALLADGASLRAFAGELRRVLAADGRVVMRHLAPSGRAESVEAVAAAAEAGALASFHGLKLRLLLALAARTPGEGVRLGEAWEVFQQCFPDRAALARRLGCDLATIGTIDAYRGQDARYIFHPLPELARAFSAFRLTAGPAGHYPFAEYCPVFSLTPRP